MGKSDELRALVAAMTPGPWEENEGGLITSERECVIVIGDNEPATAAAIAALANHADPLVDLVAACEELDRMWAGVGVYTAIARVREALKRVHEIGKDT